MRFYALTYGIGFEVDGREYELALPYDGASYSAIKEQAQVAYGVTLPDMTNEQWFAALNKFITDAIEDGVDIGPIGRINRILTERDPDPKRH
jgi:hypothetical protein